MGWSVPGGVGRRARLPKCQATTCAPGCGQREALAMIGWFLAAAMVFADVGSDLLLSRGMKQVGAAMDLSSRNLLRLPALATRNRSMLAAAALSAMHFFAFLALLSFWDLSFVVPL